jgi:hypothetical protein
MPKRWEYKIITLNCVRSLPGGGEVFNPGKRQEIELNKLGEKGFEIFFIGRVDNSNNAYFILKKEIDK